ncbi:MAG: zf-HC2 domain-containing protein [candidate division WOR-3 bacterium]|nr:MAG: zf-HC2 domain-containing protein [candidate division WOR-3 bacterium]
MKCKKVTRLLPAYLDAEADEGRKSEIERHLAGCAACRQELESLKADLELCASVEVPELSPYLATRTMAEVRSPERRRVLAGIVVRRALAGIVVRRALAGAAAAVLVAAGVWVGSFLGGEIQGSENGSSWYSVEGEPSLEDLYGLALGENGDSGEGR